MLLPGRQGLLVCRRWSGPQLHICVPKCHGQPLQPVDGHHAGAGVCFPWEACSEVLSDTGHVLICSVSGCSVYDAHQRQEYGNHSRALWPFASLSACMRICNHAAEFHVQLQLDQEEMCCWAGASAGGEEDKGADGLLCAHVQGTVLCLPDL